MIWLLACAGEPDASRYTRAATLADYDDAMDACEGIDDVALRGDCVNATAARFGRFDACATITHEGWRGECAFQHAEARARAGAWLDALAACRDSVFADNCNSHVLQMAAVTTHAGTAAEAADVLATMRPALVTPHADTDFWRARVRERLAKGLPADPESCPDQPCRVASRHEIEAAYAEAVKAGGCEARPAWIGTSEDAARWVERVRERLCPG
ncbi:MAG: hypothetical protein ACOZNI_30835 [Myxococcota bacterium]